MIKHTELNAYDISRNPVSENRIREFPTLSLAYIGDTVYDLYIRSYLVKNRMGKVMDLHRKASAVVNARAQAKAALLLKPHLNDRETEIFRLGKNVKSTPPKNMSPEDYSLATAIETVMGYLYCRGYNDRLDTLFEIIITHSFTEDKHARD